MGLGYSIIEEELFHVMQESMLSEVAHGVLGFVFPGDFESLTFFKFPVLQPDGTYSPMVQWTHVINKIHLQITCFTIEPLCDLLAVVTRTPQEYVSSLVFMWELHIRTLSTNEIHPNMPPDARFLFGKRSDSYDIISEYQPPKVSVAGHLVGCYCYRGAKSLVVVWDWKMLSDISIQGDFSFISNDRFAATIIDNIGEPRSGSIELYSLTGCWNLVAVYALPTLPPGREYDFITLGCNPLAGFVPPKGPDVFPSPEERTIICGWSLLDVEEGEEGVNEKDFLVFWDEWGPKNTRLFPDKVMAKYARYSIYGHRSVYMVECVDDSDDSRSECSVDPELLLEVRDFNPYSVVFAERFGMGRVVREPTVIAASKHTFEKDITTSLPYVETTLDQPYGNLRIAMTDGSNILIRHTLNEDIDILAL